MKHKAALFDMNGVIVDDEALHEAAFSKVLHDRGFTFTHEDYLQFFAGKTDEFGFKTFFKAKNTSLPSMQKIGPEKAQSYMQLAADSLTPYSDVIPYIHALHEAGVRLALVTSSIRIEAETVLRTFELEDMFEVVVTADEITASKPSPQGYLKAADLLRIEPSECFVIEDAPSGVAAACAAGMECVAVTNTHSEAELSLATVIVDSLSDLDDNFS